MPIIETKGGASAQGFGLFTSKPVPVDGTVGIFFIGGQNPTPPSPLGKEVDKFTYATCGSAALPNAPLNLNGGAAAGNTTTAIFQRGGCAPFGYNGRLKFTYATCSFASIPNNPYGNALRGSATGNSTRGIFQQGNSPCAPAKRACRYKYTYACDSSGPAASASLASCAGSAAGNSTRGIFQIGSCIPVAYSRVRNKYTYSTDVSTASGVAQTAWQGRYMGATGNATRGIFSLGANGATPLAPAPERGCYPTRRCKYTYACDTNAAATGTGLGGYGFAASTGNSTRGIWTLATVRNPNVPGIPVTYPKTRCKYTYSTDAATTSGVGVASVPTTAFGAASSFATCVNT